MPQYKTFLVFKKKKQGFSILVNIYIDYLKNRCSPGETNFAFT